MPEFSRKSLDKLHTCDNILQEICQEAIRVIDFSVICGHRNEQEQTKAYNEGYSKAKWGQSNHNFAPSRAIDLLPYPSGWESRDKFFELAGVIKGIAYCKGYKVRWGGEFKGFFDGAHFEIVGDI